MPYVTCPRCELTAYTAARWTTTDDCPACGTPLAGARRQSLPLASSSSIGTTTSSVGTMGSASTASSGIGSGWGAASGGVSMVTAYPST